MLSSYDSLSIRSCTFIFKFSPKLEISLPGQCELWLPLFFFSLLVCESNEDLTLAVELVGSYNAGKGFEAQPSSHFFGDFTCDLQPVTNQSGANYHSAQFNTWALR